MRVDQERPRLPGSSAPGRGLLGRVLTFAAGAVLLVLVFTLSVFLFAILVAGGLLVWGYLWWQTRELRRQLRQQMHEQTHEQTHERPPGGRVIEGEVIRADNDQDERRP